MTKRITTLFFALLSCIITLGQTENSFDEILQKAQSGNTNAMHDVATMYRKGIGTKKDVEKAIEWYKKAYKKENKKNESVADELCDLYKEEYGVEKAAVYIQEFFWDDKAVMNSRLGDLYRESLEPDMIFTTDNQERLSKAIAYYELAYDKGNKKAVKYLPTLFLKLNKKDYLRAKYYYDKGIVGWAPSGNAIKDEKTCPIADYAEVEKEIAPFESQTGEIKVQRTNVPNGETTARPSVQRKYVYAPTYRMQLTHGVIANNIEEKHIKLPWNSPLHRYPWGISLAYTQKSFKEKNGNKHGWWKSSGMSGVQVGAKYNPQLDHGIGFNTGIYYEYYYDTSTSCDIPERFEGEGKCKATLREHDIYIPLHAEYSLHLGKRFRLFVFGGLGIDYTLSASESLSTTSESNPDFKGITVSDAYDEMGYSKFGTTLEYGGGLSIEGLQVRITKGTGLNNISKNNGSDVKLDRMSVAVSIHF